MDPLMVPIMAHQGVSFLELHLRESLVYPSEGSLMVPMMAHHRLPFTGPNHSAFLRPAQIWIMRRCILHDLDVTESVIRTRSAAEKVSVVTTLSAVRMEC